MSSLFLIIYYSCPHIVQAFHVVESDSFQEILKYQCPQTKDSEIPNHKIICNEISVKSELVIQALKNKFKV